MSLAPLVFLFALCGADSDVGTSAADRVRLMKHRHATVRVNAAALLAYAPPERALASLVSALSDPAAGVRRQAAISLRVQADERAVPALVFRLEHEKAASVVVEVLAALGTSGGKYVARKVVAYLNHPQREVRAAAVLALGSLADPGQRDALWSVLRHDPHDPGFRVRCSVLGAFVNLGWKDDTARALTELEEMGALRHWYARATMCSAVGFAGMKDRIDWVREILDDSEDARVVAAATEALARLGATDEVHGLLDHSAAIVRRAALVSLHEVEDSRAIPAARRLLRDDPDPAVRFEAALLLHRAKSPGADAFLVDALRSRNPVFWITALTSLERRHGVSFGRDAKAWTAWLKKRPS
ncbi:MAG: HEAT repeat domain-containing protein [Planctomycetota bacterium]